MEMTTTKNHPLDKYYKEDIHSSLPSAPGIQYAIFKLGKKYKDIPSLKQFQAYLQRKIKTPNADPSKTDLNQILKGHEDIENLVGYYIKEVKIKKNQIIARDGLITASKEFFNDLSQEQMDLWVKENLKFLELHFNNNLLFACLHLDETTPHIHYILSFKNYDTKAKCYKLQHNHYFDGRDMLIEWQDTYYQYISKTFPKLQRGAKYTKASFLELKRLHGILVGDNLEMSEQDAKTKLQWLDIKYKRMEQRINDITKINNELLIENSDLKDRLEYSDKELHLIANAVHDLMIRKHIPEKELETSKNNVQVQQAKQSQGKSIGS
jgi:hypothetical protein